MVRKNIVRPIKAWKKPTAGLKKTKTKKNKPLSQEVILEIEILILRFHRRRYPSNSICDQRHLSVCE